MKQILCSLLSVGLLALSACAGVPLPKEQREFHFVETTEIKQKDAYAATLSYLAKNLGDSNFAIKVKDSDSGTIVTQMIVECNELRAFMDILGHGAEFNLEVNTKDNKIRFAYEAVSDQVSDFNGKVIRTDAVSTPEMMATIKNCAQKSKGEIMRSIASKKDSNW